MATSNPIFTPNYAATADPTALMTNASNGISRVGDVFEKMQANMFEREAKNKELEMQQKRLDMLVEDKEGQKRAMSIFNDTFNQVSSLATANADLLMEKQQLTDKVKYNAATDLEKARLQEINTQLEQSGIPSGLDIASFEGRMNLAFQKAIQESGGYVPNSNYISTFLQGRSDAINDRVKKSAELSAAKAAQLAIYKDPTKSVANLKEMFPDASPADLQSMAANLSTIMNKPGVNIYNSESILTDAIRAYASTRRSSINPASWFFSPYNQKLIEQLERPSTDSTGQGTIDFAESLKKLRELYNK